MTVVPVPTDTTSRRAVAEPALAAGPAPGRQRRLELVSTSVSRPSATTATEVVSGFPKPAEVVPAPSRSLRLVREAGMASAEYAVALIAACAFAAVLLAAVRTSQVMSAIGKLIAAALRVIS